MSVRVTDRGANAVVRALAGASRIRIGVLGSETYPDGTSVAEVGEMHEFGLGVPQRSWLRDFVDVNDGLIKADFRSIARAVEARRGTLLAGLTQLGAKIVAGIQVRIANQIPPALAESTLLRRRHGGTVPLIDTGQLRSSISFVVESGGSEGVEG